MKEVCYHNETLYTYTSWYERLKIIYKLGPSQQLHGSLIT